MDQGEVDNMIKSTEILLNAKEIIFLTMAFSLNLWFWIFFELDFYYFSFTITFFQIFHSIYLIIKLKNHRTSQINIVETLNILLTTVKCFLILNELFLK